MPETRPKVSGYDIRKIFGDDIVNPEMIRLVEDAVNYGMSQYTEGVLEGIRSLNEVKSMLPVVPEKPTTQTEMMVRDVYLRIQERIDTMREAIGIGPEGQAS